MKTSDTTSMRSPTADGRSGKPFSTVSLEFVWSTLAAVEKFLDKHPFVVIGVFSVLYFIITSFHAARKLFWYDELFTWYMCALPNLHSIWAALIAGADL